MCNVAKITEESIVDSAKKVSGQVSNKKCKTVISM